MKRTIPLLIMFLLFSAGSVRSEEKKDYSASYGKGLYDVPTVIRLKFQSANNKAWHDATEAERRDFLIKWEASRKMAIQDKKAFIKNIEKSNKLLLNAQNLRQKQEQERARRKETSARAKATEKRLSDKKIADMKRQREKARETLRRMQESRNRRNNH
jgi:hypothetical protein